jgi:hypothetical protein
VAVLRLRGARNGEASRLRVACVPILAVGRHGLACARSAGDTRPSWPSQENGRSARCAPPAFDDCEIHDFARLCCLTFELSGRRRLAAGPWPAMIFAYPSRPGPGGKPLALRLSEELGRTATDRLGNARAFTTGSDFLVARHRTTPPGRGSSGGGTPPPQRTQRPRVSRSELRRAPPQLPMAGHRWRATQPGRR